MCVLYMHVGAHACGALMLMFGVSLASVHFIHWARVSSRLNSLVPIWLV